MKSNNLMTTIVQVQTVQRNLYDPQERKDQTHTWSQYVHEVEICTRLQQV